MTTEQSSSFLTIGGIMKTHLAVLTFFFLSFISCKENVSEDTIPEETTFLESGSYSGSFEVTFSSYRSSRIPATLKGQLSMEILNNGHSYSYTGIVNESTDTSSISIKLIDGGSITPLKDKLIMTDLSWIKSTAWWENSMYLIDTFNVEKIDDTFRIIRNSSFANWKISIKKQ